MKLTDSGRTVYGGGGITPDVKIAAVKSNHFQDSLLQHYAFFNFAKHYVINHHPDPKTFEVDDVVLQDFRKFLDDEKIAYTEAELLENNDWVRSQHQERSLCGRVWAGGRTEGAGGNRSASNQGAGTSAAGQVAGRERAPHHCGAQFGPRAEPLSADTVAEARLRPGFSLFGTLRRLGLPTAFWRMHMIKEGVLVLAGLLAAVAGWMDWRSRRIPNWLTVPGLLLGVAANSVAAGWTGAKSALLGAGLGLALLLPFVLVRSLGAGDWKLVGAIGAFLGPGPLVVVLMGTVFVAGGMALVLIIVKKRVRQTMRNIGRILAALLSLHLPGQELTLDNPESLKVPFGVAVAVTVILYAVRQTLGAP